jgi:hypothetical protein
VKRLLQGHRVADVAAPGTMADPTALEPFLRMAHARSITD